MDRIQLKASRGHEEAGAQRDGGQADSEGDDDQRQGDP